MRTWPPRKSNGNGTAEGWRSGLEEKLGAQLKAAGVVYEYEPFRIPFSQPAKPRHYTPDYVLPSGIVIESKGRFVTADRQKHLLIQQQHPDLDIRFVFSNPNTRISKQSKTTYADWCNSKGFKFAKGSIPESWLAEPKRVPSIRAIRKITGEKSEYGNENDGK